MTSHPQRCETCSHHILQTLMKEPHLCDHPMLSDNDEDMLHLITIDEFIRIGTMGCASHRSKAPTPTAPEQYCKHLIDPENGYKCQMGLQTSSDKCHGDMSIRCDQRKIKEVPDFCMTKCPYAILCSECPSAATIRNQTLEMVIKETIESCSSGEPYVPNMIECGDCPFFILYDEGIDCVMKSLRTKEHP